MLILHCYISFGKKTTLLVQGDYLNAQLTPDFGIGSLDSGRVLPTALPVSRFLNVLWAYNNVKQSSGSFNIDSYIKQQLENYLCRLLYKKQMWILMAQACQML